MDISVVPTESIPLESAVARTLEGQTGVWNCHPSGTDPRCTVLCSSRTLPRYRPTRYGPPCSTRPPGPAINQHGRVCLVLSIQTNPTAHFASFSSLSLFCLFPLLPLSPPPRLFSRSLQFDSHFIHFDSDSRIPRLSCPHHPPILSFILHLHLGAAPVSPLDRAGCRSLLGSANFNPSN